MGPVIRQLIIQGFRSFRSETVDFENPTFLVGHNGSGKSNLLDALDFLNEATMRNLLVFTLSLEADQARAFEPSRPARPLRARRRLALRSRTC
jgi:predicted ATP-dependent endonuclease of OLD family